jgi:hypothetical protein
MPSHSKPAAHGGALPVVLLQRAWAQYLTWLTKRPLTTKTITGGLLALLGELLQQLYFSTSRRVDAGRLLKMTSFSVLMRPVMHYKYMLLDMAVPGSDQLSVYGKLALDQLVGDPIFYVLWYLYDGLVREQSVANVPRVVKKELWSMMLANWSVWPFVQWVTFTFVPPHLRVLFGNLVGLVWNIYFSWRDSKQHHHSKKK